ncbi:MAG TPA: hypothetical protein VGQ50_10680 [Actinomycetota bacterium]|jgi:hypothetical protein|nr:hypothetical protein [Actinomycetota bacterium]
MDKWAKRFGGGFIVSAFVWVVLRTILQWQLIDRITPSSDLVGVSAFAGGFALATLGRDDRHRLDAVVASSRAVGVVQALARSGLVAPRPRAARGLAVTKRTRTSPDKNARWAGLGINSALACR